MFFENLRFNYITIHFFFTAPIIKSNKLGAGFSDLSVLKKANNIKVITFCRVMSLPILAPRCCNHMTNSKSYSFCPTILFTLGFYEWHLF